jgi:hypothetical protein
MFHAHSRLEDAPLVYAAATAVAAPAPANATRQLLGAAKRQEEEVGAGIKDALCVSGISYKNITGSSRHAAGGIWCPDDIKCTGIAMDNVHIKPTDPTPGPHTFGCRDAKITETSVSPAVTGC